MQIEDIEMVRQLLHECIVFYQNMNLSNDCDKMQCRVPAECAQHNAIYNILHYLVDNSFITENASVYVAIVMFDSCPYILFSLSTGNNYASVHCYDIHSDSTQHKSAATLLSIGKKVCIQNNLFISLYFINEVY